MGDFGGDEGLAMKVGEEKEFGEQGLKKKLLKEGEGLETPKLGDEVEVHVTCTILNGEKIYSSRDDHGKPSKFKLGEDSSSHCAYGQVEGWVEAIKTMKIGENALFTIPPELAYGASGFPPDIPPNATLQFDIMMLSCTNSRKSYIDDGIFKKILKEGEKWENPKDSDEVLVKYEAKLLDGSAVSKSEGVRFVVKDGYFCPALAKAVKTMKKAEKAHLTVNSQYGFGEKGRPATGEEGAVPPNASFCIDIELVSFGAPAAGTSIEAKFRHAYAKAIKSVVTVVTIDSSNQERDFCSGFVLLKSTTRILIMTATFLVGRQCDIHVHFSDSTVMAAKVMLQGSQFSVLTVQTQQTNICQPVSFRKEPARYEDVMILATVSWKPVFGAIDGSVIQESCLGCNKRKKVVEESDNYFITSCPFYNIGNLGKSTLMSSAVFDTDGDAVGFIIADCSTTLSGRRLKRVMHAKRIANVIRSMTCVSVPNWEEEDMCLITKGNWADALLSLERKEYQKKTRIIKKFRPRRSGE